MRRLARHRLVEMQMERNRRRGFSLVELLIVIAIILIILGVALPRLNQARISANEMSAVRSITVIHTAEQQYMSQFGKFAGSLEELGPPTSGASSATAADLLTGDLSKGEKQGFRFTLQANPAGYIINAAPVGFGTTGKRTFYSDQSMTIRANPGQEPAGPTSPELK
jgi:type IV pilus assembly protein PilA